MRNDIHSPTNFDPAKYAYLGVVYVGHAQSEIMQEIIQAYLDHNNDYDADYLLDLARESSFDGNYKQKGTCDHCGARFAYGAVYKHENGDVIVVGHECSFKSFGFNSRLDYDMAKVQKVIDEARKAAKSKVAALEFLSKNDGLAEALEAKHHIVIDIKAKLFQYGSLSPAQVALVFKLAAQVKEQEARQVEEESLPKAPVIEGRITVRGTILGFKEVDAPRFSYYSSGTAWKMLVRDDRGFKVFGTMPASVCPNDRGKVIEFSATVEKGRQDEFFGFFKRPVKVKVLEIA